MSESPSVAPSPLLSLPGAVAGPDDSLDAGVAWHYGDPLREQRNAETGAAIVDRSNRFVLSIGGAERLTWLHTISSQHIAQLPDGGSAENLSLDLNGRVEEHFVLTDLDGVTWIDTEPTHGPGLLAFLQKMVFWAKAEPAAAPEMAVLSLLGPDVRRPKLLAALGIAALPPVYGAVALPGGGFLRSMPWPGEHAFDLIVPRERLSHWWETLTAAGAAPAGSWAFEALRVAAVRPRIGVDTDERTIPHEARWIGGIDEHGAVHLDKGCYRGQETVARVHNLGKPPRHLVLLHLDGSADTRPEPGDPVTADGRAVGHLGTVVDHHELGPIALALIKRTVPADTALLAGSVAASIDAESVPSYDAVQAGRAAVDRLRGR
ncbi:CAF17-like 4Fe-4S cluster assembly/insertion protein YgfZ [Rhodococcus sp. UNC363MFTsu5.1]|uniref:CAF17-like 4Fe-4S cluster assembly/insertion protein YgfZ n=1 Tax=Rhodococcus sp. UNC363MFTsu5.1 TaxID=1449069 RepID=UPI000485EDBA|nr:folate-binding protein YgfZ [Rhodococcus sp. UNC363MFTsu5.1]